MLEAEIWLVAKFVLGLGFLHHDDVLDADAEAAVFVVSGFVGDDISWCEWDFGVLDSGADSDGPFMDVQIGSYPVTCAMSVVQSFFLLNS